MMNNLKVLMVNSFFYNRGGAEISAWETARVLEEQGHRVIPFSMKHPKNAASDYEKYFVSHIDYIESLQNFSLKRGLKVLGRSIYSREARKNLNRLIADERPDIAHLHNIHHFLTPSILYELKSLDIPIVWTLHDYKLLCPNSNFLAGGVICERCRRRKYYRAVLTRCKKDSLAASLVAATEAYVHWLLGIEKIADRYIAPSLFLKKKFVEYGFEESRIVHIPNFIQNNISATEAHDGYFVYIGRLWVEKGIDVLAEAMANVKGAKLVIVGDGPQRSELEKMLDRRDNVEFLGQLSTPQTSDILRKAMFVVVPSKCYENFLFTILEAFSWGKPVIGARSGGIAELIDDNMDGLLFEMGDPIDLAQKINYLIRNRRLLNEMGLKGKRKVEEKYSADKYYQNLMDVYDEVIRSRT